MDSMEGLKQALEYILTPSREIFIVGALIVFLLPILVHFYISQSTPYTALPSILLVGPPGGGKTSLMTLLERGDSATATHTSQVPESIELTVSSDHGATTFREAARIDAPGTHRKFLLVDTPGHGKLRNQHAMTHVASDTLRGIIYMLDAASLEDTLADAAGYLYDVLLALQKRTGAGKTSKTPNAIHVLLAANKLDLFTALPASLVKSNLEAELGRIRKSRSKGLLDSGVGEDEIGSEEQDGWLGAYGSEKFTFGQMREFDIEVDIVGGSVLEGKVDKWWDWISQRI
ncbi:P-loop containing nucleoside triphosphate hydrolase protein [Annulohypoxylon truncatum]|uniref:P-loop containing nucleoside triphosphate hydrolase protein n=1 Tax=Annulohypoxylon truncatum TaxID=327061 RepID=UPI002007BA28|nr:P-loop containing nucleoside triphosphate hydrolase protein [Annulohypoxylon truncatum]KAI1213557.1 P-loop containing nucleoside triphosphate hydrolase protein [Annulohypoxylon truncatum]